MIDIQDGDAAAREQDTDELLEATKENRKNSSLVNRGLAYGRISTISPGDYFLTEGHRMRR